MAFVNGFFLLSSKALAKQEIFYIFEQIQINLKTKGLLYLISFIEGSALMAAELISAKVMAPYYGSSLYVWTSVFVCTLSGLAAGYFLGAKLSLKPRPMRYLPYILAFSTFYFLAMSPLAGFMMESTLSLPIRLGSLLSVLVFLFPLLLAFGIVSPLVIKILTEDPRFSGENAGKIYTLSTCGGILTTLLFGFYFIPELGISTSIYVSAFFLSIASLMAFWLLKTNHQALN